MSTARYPLVQGAGGGGGGGGSESSDTVRGTQIFDVLDLISEGECEGLVNGLQSIYYDGVPLQAADGTMNFADVSVQTTPGTQGQAAIAGVDGVQNEVGVGVNVLFATPVVRSITNPAIDTCRVTIVVPQLSNADADTGDLGGSSFGWSIEVQSHGGGFVEVFRETVSAKTMSRYPRAQQFALAGPAPWDIKVRRLTADSASANTVNAFGWSTYTEIQSVKLRYPNSCLVRSRGNAQQFSRVPVRSFDWLGMRIPVPSNYEPKTRTYAGIWDGTFKQAWTDNPAWIYHDMVVHDRYGLGRYVQTTDSFKWELYTIARYCDGMVPDGNGGMEPRFRASPGFETREQAYKVLTDLAAIFRGIVFWLNADVSVAQDAPSDPVAVFTPANVVPSAPGRYFSYTGSSNAARYSSVIVWFNDLSQQGKLVPEVVVDPDLEAELGVKPLELSPMGIWSRGQAHRIGKWALYTQEQETEGVAFKVGLDGTLVQPGKVFQVADPNEAGERLAGRISAATPTQVTLDADVVLRPGESYSLTVMLPDAADSARLVPQLRAVSTPAGGARILTVAAPFSAAPARETVWLLQSDQVAATAWRCIGVTENGADNTFTVSGIAHQPAKYALIDQGVKFTKPPVSRVLLTPPVPGGPLRLTEAAYLSGSIAKSRVTVSWVAPLVGLAYLVRWRLNAGPWTEQPWTNDNSVDLDGLAKGLLEAGVRSRNALGNVSNELPGSVQLLGWVKKPGNVANFRAQVVQGGVLFTWDAYQPDNYLTTTLRIGAGILFEGAASSWLWPWPAIGTYAVTAVHWDTSLNASPTPAPLTVVVDATVLTQWANLAGKPANLAALTGAEAIRNADIVVGGVNLLTGSTDFGRFDHGSGSTIVATGQLDHLGGHSATRIAFTGNTAGERYRRVVGLRVGGLYTLSVWVLRESGSNFCFTATDGSSWAASVGTVSTAAIGTWSRLSMAFTSGSNVVDICLGGHSKPGLQAQAAATVLLAFPQLEEGNAATQWTAAPEDVYAIIAGAQKAADDANAELAAFSDDNVLDRGEKPSVVLDWTRLANDKPTLDAQAIAYGIGPERVAFDADVDALGAYLNGIPGGWSNTAFDSPVDRGVFRAKWAAAFAAEGVLLAKITAVAGTLASWQGVANRPQDQSNFVHTPTFNSGAGQWPGVVVPVSGKAWTTALQTTVRDLEEPVLSPVTPGETLYAYADLYAVNALGGVAFGVEGLDASGAATQFSGGGGQLLPPGTGWTRVGGPITLAATTTRIIPWFTIQAAPGSTGTALGTNFYIGRAQPGATLGADWATNVTGAAAVEQRIADARHAADQAAQAASDAASAASTANRAIAITASDGWLSRGEKPDVILRWGAIANEKASIDANADNYTVSHAAYDQSVDTLAGYLNRIPGGWADTSVDSQIDPAAFQASFLAVYTARQQLLDAISAQAKARLGGLATLNSVGTPQINDRAVTSDKIVDLRTSNYSEDGAGNPTAGAKLSAVGTALKVANGNLQIGSVLFSDYWARLVQAVDGSASGGFFVWRGNNDASTRRGVPNIACLSVQAEACVIQDNSFQQCWWKYSITPSSYTAFTDNLDAVFQLRVRLYASTGASAPFIDTNFAAPSRCYDGSTGAVRGAFNWAWRDATGPMLEVNKLYAGYMRCTLVNAYGQSADADFGPNTTRGANLPLTSITGQTGSSGSGGGSAGGGCPAPWVKVRLASGQLVPASNLANGVALAAVNDETLEPIAGGGAVRDLRTIWRDRWRLCLVDGRASEWSRGHRFGVVDRGWVEVENLRPGDHVVGPREAIVESVLMVGEGQVVSFRVEAGGTYFAGDLLCHNRKEIP